MWNFSFVLSNRHVIASFKNIDKKLINPRRNFNKINNNNSNNDILQQLREDFDRKNGEIRH